MSNTDLPRALAGTFTPEQLDLIAGYLTPRAREARATNRADADAALSTLAAIHIEARDEARTGALTPGVPITLLDLDDVAVGRRIVASLLDAGWTPPDPRKEAP